MFSWKWLWMVLPAMLLTFGITASLGDAGASGWPYIDTRAPSLDVGFYKGEHPL